MAKSRRGNSGAFASTLLDQSLLKEFLIKKFDAESRIGRNFICFIRYTNGGLFLYGGDVEGGLYSNDIFSAAYIGSSAVEVAEIRNVITSTASRVKSSFSRYDFHPQMLLGFLSRYLKAAMENIETPRALAAEVIISDVENKLININSSGDYVEADLSQEKKRVYVAGCYDREFAEKLINKVLKFIKNDDGIVSGEKAGAVSMALSKSLKIKNLNSYWYRLGNDMNRTKTGSE